MELRKYYPLIPILLTSVTLLIVRLTIPELSQLVSLALFYVALGEAFNVFTGLTLYVCFGYVAFIALGMYGSGSALKYILATSNPPLIITVLFSFAIAGLFAFILALVIGSIGLRLRGAFFAIATVGLNEGLKNFIEGTGIWGGSSGLIIAGDLISSYGHETYVFVSTELADYLMFIVYVLSLLIMLLIMKSRLGYGLTALREDEDIANVMGVNTVKYKLITFIISAVLAGMIGATKMLKDLVIYPPQAFAISYTVEAIVITMLGGLGTVMGPVVGGLLYSILKYMLTVSFPGLQLLILAPALIAICVLFPYGIVGWIKRKFRGLLIDYLLI